jgi:Asp-tRNA(Asn)/Glu-tRNA(Gln) amidotransferase A subunit family amidase
MSYDLKSFKLPRLGDRALHSVVALLENQHARHMLESALLKETGVTLLRQEPFDEAPAFQPLHPVKRALAANTAKASLAVLQSVMGVAGKCPASPVPSVSDYVLAYRSGSTTPTRMAEQLITAIAESNAGKLPLHAVISTMDQDIRRQARESEQRFSEGKPLGLLDGVPVLVKDELNAVPYTTTAGTLVYGQDASVAQDATVVSRMRAEGAIIIGKANMHEIGIGVTGANVNYGHCRNPYAPHAYTGGSSSGSAAAVAAALCPLSIGADGGGSIRIPAALCGMVGLKPTFGRVSEYGAFPLCWSLAHIGPIGATVDDVALGYATMAGADIFDANTMLQPPVHLTDYLKRDLTGVKLGVFSPWFSHASREIVQNCQVAIEMLKALGATVQEISIDMLELQRVAHAVTISSEMLTAVQQEYLADPRKFAGDTRLALALARCFSSTDYIRAQRMRTRSIAQYYRIFQQVDMIVTPTTGIVAPPIMAKDDDSCEASLSVLTDLMRFCFVANLTGLPALTLPVQPVEAVLSGARHIGAGLSDSVYPVGLQLMAKPWHEHLLLRTARALESEITRTRPALRFSPL